MKRHGGDSWWSWAFRFARGAEAARAIATKDPGLRAAWAGHLDARADRAMALAGFGADIGEPFDPLRLKLPERHLPPAAQALRAAVRGEPLPDGGADLLAVEGWLQPDGQLNRGGLAVAARLGVLPPKQKLMPGPKGDAAELRDEQDNPAPPIEATLRMLDRLIRAPMYVQPPPALLLNDRQVEDLKAEVARLQRVADDAVEAAEQARQAARAILARR